MGVVFQYWHEACFKERRGDRTIISKVLIVDSDKLTRWSLKEAFSQEGLRVETADSIAGAAGKLGEDSFDLIIIDAEIDGDGFSGLRELIQTGQPDAFVVVLTSLQAEQVRLRMSGLPDGIVVEKPFSSERLKGLCREVLAMKTSRGG